MSQLLNRLCLEVGSLSDEEIETIWQRVDYIYGDQHVPEVPNVAIRPEPNLYDCDPDRYWLPWADWIFGPDPRVENTDWYRISFPAALSRVSWGIVMGSLSAGLEFTPESHLTGFTRHPVTVSHTGDHVPVSIQSSMDPQPPVHGPSSSTSFGASDSSNPPTGHVQGSSSGENHPACCERENSPTYGLFYMIGLWTARIALRYIATGCPI